jgi:hypothetical protein
MHKADAAVERRLEALAPAERDAMEARSTRGGRGFDGAVYACDESMDHEVFGLRMAVYGCVTALAAMARRIDAGAFNPAVAERLLAELGSAAAHEDLGGIFPTHLMRGGAAGTARSALDSLS